MTKWIAAAILFTSSFAHAFSFLDFGLKTGLTIGSLTKTDISTGDVEPYGFGGILFALGYNVDLTPKFTFLGDLHIVTDPSTFQVTRTGFDLTVLYHLVGGSKRLAQDFGYFEAVERQAFNFSIAVRTGLHRYSAASPLDGVSLSGSVYDAMAGLHYRQDLNDRESLAVELYTTVLSFSASLDQVVSSQMLFLGTYRFYL